MPTDPGYRQVYTTTAKKPATKATLYKSGKTGGTAPTIAKYPTTAANAFEARVAAAGKAPAPPAPDYAAQLGDWWSKNGPVQQQNASLGTMYNTNSSGRSRGGGGGGGGGGGRPAPSAALLAAVNKAFTLDESPYWYQQQALDTQRARANAYNPDFGSYEQTALAGGQRIASERDAAIQQRMAELAQLGNTLSTQSGAAMAGAARDLQGQGFNAQPYFQQAGAMAGSQLGNVGNMGNYLTMLNLNNANSTADWQRGLGTIRQGAEGALANAKGQLGFQLDQQGAQIQQQAMAARLANEQAKLNYMIQNGLIQ